MHTFKQIDDKEFAIGYYQSFGDVFHILLRCGTYREAIAMVNYLNGGNGALR